MPFETKAALVYGLGGILTEGGGVASPLIFLVLLVAFNIIDHVIRLEHLEELGLGKPVWNWVYSFLSWRTQKVMLEG